MNEFPAVGETTCSLSTGNVRFASIAFTDSPPVFTKMETVNVLPVTNDPPEGETYNEARFLLAPPPCHYRGTAYRCRSEQTFRRKKSFRVHHVLCYHASP